MSFDWRLYVQLSQELIRSQKTTALREAYFRTCISRAYYGCFCSARNRKGMQHIKKDVHRTVINSYKSSPVNSDKQVGVSLDRLRKRRVKADYDDKAIGVNMAMTAVIEAQNILADLGPP